MRIRWTSRSMPAVIGGTAGLLALAGAAFACTQMQGRMVLSAGRTTSQVVADSDGGHTYCGVQGGAAAPAGGAISLRVAPYVNQGLFDPCPTSSLQPSADPPGGPYWKRCEGESAWRIDDGSGNPDGPVFDYTACATGAGLYRYVAGIGPYEVRFQKGHVFGRPAYDHGDGFSGYASCIDDPVGTPDDPVRGYYVIGSMRVGQDGTGAWSGNLPARLAPSAVTDAAAVCIRAEREAVDPPDDPAALVPGYYADQKQVSTNQAPIVVI